MTIPAVLKWQRSVQPDSRLPQWTAPASATTSFRIWLDDQQGYHASYLGPAWESPIEPHGALRAFQTHQSAKAACERHHKAIEHALL
jgi:hypothetical protein